MVLETLGWGREPREDVSFVLEARLHFTQPTDVNWRNLFSVKMAPVSAILVTLGQNTLTPTLKFERYFMFLYWLRVGRGHIFLSILTKDNPRKLQKLSVRFFVYLI
jgi:hypothetical protein